MPAALVLSSEDILLCCLLEQGGTYCNLVGYLQALYSVKLTSLLKIIINAGFGAKVTNVITSNCWSDAIFIVWFPHRKQRLECRKTAHKQFLILHFLQCFSFTSKLCIQMLSFLSSLSNSIESKMQY